MTVLLPTFQCVNYGIFTSQPLLFVVFEHSFYVTSLKFEDGGSITTRIGILLLLFHARSWNFSEQS